MTTPAALAADAHQAELDAIVAEWVRVRKKISRHEAKAAELLAAGMDLAFAEMATLRGMSAEREIPLRSVIAEFATAGRIPHRTVESMAHEAHYLVHSFPQTHEALAAGDISLHHARAILNAEIPVGADAPVVAEYERRVLERARCETAARVRPFARSLSAALFPRDIHADHVAARERRGVRLVDLDDGMSDLIATLPAVLAHACYDRLTQIARVAKSGGGAASGVDAAGLAKADTRSAGRAVGTGASGGAGGVSGVTDAAGAEHDPRTIDQLRADIFSDILLTADPASIDRTGVEAIQAHVQVTIPVRTLAGTTDHGAELSGYGAIDPELIRDLARLATGWDRLFLDPVTDMVTRTDRYRPTSAMRRHLRARDERCRFPGCRRAAIHADIDHSHDHARGGPTAIGNLAHLCGGHHSLKHPDVPERHRWRVRQLDAGVLEWTSPTGRVYTDRPPPRVTFE